MSLIGSISSWWTAFWAKGSGSSTGGTYPTTSGENVSEDTALNCSAVWCATNVLCGTGASLPLPVYRGGDGEERTKDRSHKLWYLLNVAPNSEMSAFQFRTIMWIWQVNWGNAYAEIQREGNGPDGEIVALWPLHPARVEVCRDSMGTLFYKVRNDAGEIVPLETWEMFHVQSIITDDGIVGHGVIAHARQTIGAAIGAEKYGAAWFGSAGIPRVVVEHPGTWDPDQRKAFRKEWDEIHSGPDGHRVALLMGGAKAVPLSMSADDSQFLGQRAYGNEEIARWYLIPPHLLQSLDRATFNNIEELGINFVRYCLLLWCRSWETAIRQRLFTESERATYFVEHNVDALLRGNHAARSAFYTAMTNAALMTRNECRKLENLDAVDGGDTFLVQGAMVPLAEDGRPESKFASTTGNMDPIHPDDESQDQPTSPEEDQTDAMEPTREDAHSGIASGIHRIIEHDLARFLTKESKAMANYAKKPGEFVSLVDKFYCEHRLMLVDEITDTMGVLTLCGHGGSVDTFVASWIGEGKEAILSASGTAGPAELTAAIQGAIDSRNWQERPQRAVDRLKNACN